MLHQPRCLSVPLSAIVRFYMYKLPKEHGRKGPLEGQTYLLLEKGSEGWTQGKGSVNDSTGALGRTVGQVYSQGKVRRHFVWNKHGLNGDCSFWVQLSHKLFSGVL